MTAKHSEDRGRELGSNFHTTTVLILAFTFTGALGRIDLRRQLIVKEANAIGTAYLLLDLLPNGDRHLFCTCPPISDIETE